MSGVNYDSDGKWSQWQKKLTSFFLYFIYFFPVQISLSHFNFLPVVTFFSFFLQFRESSASFHRRRKKKNLVASELELFFFLAANLIFVSSPYLLLCNYRLLRTGVLFFLRLQWISAEEGPDLIFALFVFYFLQKTSQTRQRLFLPPPDTTLLMLTPTSRDQF